MDAVAANLLCDAAELLDIQAGDLPQHHPIGHLTPLGSIPAFAAGLISPRVEARRRAALAAKLAARCDLSGSPLGSMPDDTSLNLSGY